jgi:hypothetical protein
MIMRVEFHKGGDGRLCDWVATPPKRRPRRVDHLRATASRSR